MSFDGGEGKVEWNEGGAHIGGFPISTEEAIRRGYGPPVDGNAGFGSQLPEPPSEVVPNLLIGAWVGVVLSIPIGLGVYIHDNYISPKPTEQTSAASTAPANKTRVQAPQLVEGAYYRARNATAPAAIETPQGPVVTAFSKSACVLVTNSSYLFGNDVVEISIKSPTGGHIKAITHSTQLVLAPECNNTMR